VQHRQQTMPDPHKTVAVSAHGSDQPGEQAVDEPGSRGQPLSGAQHQHQNMQDPHKTVAVSAHGSVESASGEQAVDDRPRLMRASRSPDVLAPDSSELINSNFSPKDHNPTAPTSWLQLENLSKHIRSSTSSFLLATSPAKIMLGCTTIVALLVVMYLISLWWRRETCVAHSSGSGVVNDSISCAVAVAAGDFGAMVGVCRKRKEQFFRRLSNSSSGSSGASSSAALGVSRTGSRRSARLQGDSPHVQIHGLTSYTSASRGRNRESKPLHNAGARAPRLLKHMEDRLLNSAERVETSDDPAEPTEATLAPGVERFTDADISLGSADADVSTSSIDVDSPGI